LNVEVKGTGRRHASACWCCVVLRSLLKTDRRPFPISNPLSEMLFQKAVVLCFAGCSVAQSLRSLPKQLHERQDASPTNEPAAQSTACGDIIAAVDNDGA